MKLSFRTMTIAVSLIVLVTACYYDPETESFVNVIPTYIIADSLEFDQSRPTFSYAYIRSVADKTHRLLFFDRSIPTHWPVHNAEINERIGYLTWVKQGSTLMYVVRMDYSFGLYAYSTAARTSKKVGDVIAERVRFMEDGEWVLVQEFNDTYMLNMETNEKISYESIIESIDFPELEFSYYIRSPYNSEHGYELRAGTAVHIDGNTLMIPHEAYTQADSSFFLLPMALTFNAGQVTSYSFGKPVGSDFLVSFDGETTLTRASGTTENNDYIFSVYDDEHNLVESFSDSDALFQPQAVGDNGLYMMYYNRNRDFNNFQRVKMVDVSYGSISNPLPRVKHVHSITYRPAGNEFLSTIEVHGLGNQVLLIDRQFENMVVVSDTNFSYGHTAIRP